MKPYKILWRMALIIAMAALAWLAWQSPMPASRQSAIQARAPDAGDVTKSAAVAGGALWRVVTHRVISREGISALKKRLVAMHLTPIAMHSTEEMTMHAFDDAVLFKSSRQAHAMAKFWQQHDIETNVIRAAKGVYLLGLGRYYQPKYAEELQQQLDHVGRKYRYQQRRVPISVVRFTFTPGNKQQAEQLWKKLNVTGVVMPALMTETQFARLYGNNIQ